MCHVPLINIVVCVDSSLPSCVQFVLQLSIVSLKSLKTDKNGIRVKGIATRA